MSTLIEELATNLLADESAAKARRKEAWREYVLLLESADDANGLLALVKELGVSPGDFQKHAQAFDALRSAHKAAPTSEALAGLVEARAAAERASTAFEKDELHKLRKQFLDAIAAARSGEHAGLQATGAVRECEKRVHALLPEAFPLTPVPKPEPAAAQPVSFAPILGAHVMELPAGVL